MRKFIIILLLLLTVFSCSQENKHISESSLASLSLKGIKNIPMDVFAHKKVKYLSVYGQDCDIAGMECFAIKEIPPQIQELKKLETLVLTLNYIEKLPPEILELKNLKTLDLSENPNFIDIETVSKIKSLEKFYCYGCHLSEEKIQVLKDKLPNCEVFVE